MAAWRTKVLSIRLTTDEWAAIAHAAAGQSLSTWTRATLLRAVAAPPADQILLAEILAVRTLVLHVQMAVNNGEALTTEHLERLMVRVDQDTMRDARARLAPRPLGRIR